MSRRKNLVHRVAMMGLLTVLIVMAPSDSMVAQEYARDLDAERLARGRVSYRIYCQNCHGKSGQGDGSIADLLKVPPADLTQLTSKKGSFPANLAYQVIDGRQDVKGHGRREMPIWGVAFQEQKDSDQEAKVREKILDLVFFIESIQVVDGNADTDG